MVLWFDVVEKWGFFIFFDCGVIFLIWNYLLFFFGLKNFVGSLKLGLSFFFIVFIEVVIVLYLDVNVIIFGGVFSYIVNEFLYFVVWCIYLEFDFLGNRVLDFLGWDVFGLC